MYLKKVFFASGSSVWSLHQLLGFWCLYHVGYHRTYQSLMLAESLLDDNEYILLYSHFGHFNPYWHVFVLGLSHGAQNIYIYKNIPENPDTLDI